MNKWEIFPHDLLVEDKDGLFIRGHYFSPTFLPNGHLSLIRNSPKDRVVLQVSWEAAAKAVPAYNIIAKSQKCIKQGCFFTFLGGARCCKYI